MSIHIAAKLGDIAETVLLPGDPRRAKYIAENMLEEAKCYSTTRNMYGFTGKYKGKRISVQGTGMGIPSMSIYANELLVSYGVKTLVRVGSCGCIQPNLKIGDLVLAMTASTDSNINKIRFSGMDYSPCADFGLLNKAYETALESNIEVNVGGILTSDTFYYDDPDDWKIWAKFGILALEMETTGLYTLAAKYSAKALSILTVSDDLINKKAASTEQRETSFTNMIRLALDTVT